MAQEIFQKIKIVGHILKSYLQTIYSYYRTSISETNNIFQKLRFTNPVADNFGLGPSRYREGIGRFLNF